MFDLDKAIRDWRRQMLAAGIKTPVPMEELEIHLREDIERRMDAGVGAREALDAAIRRIGQAGLIQAEFAKVGSVMSARQHQVTWILCGVCAVFDVLMGVAFLCNVFPVEPLTLRERLLGAGAWFLFPVILWSWRYSYRFVPVLSDKRRRLFIALLACAMGSLATGVLLPFVPARADGAGPFVVAYVWSFLPWVIGATVIFGLEEAAYRKLATSGS